LPLSWAYRAPVEQRLVQPGIGNDLRPFRKRQIGGHHHRGLLGPLRDDLEELHSALPLNKPVAECVVPHFIVSKEKASRRSQGPGACLWRASTRSFRLDGQHCVHGELLARICPCSARLDGGVFPSVDALNHLRWNRICCPKIGGFNRNARVTRVTLVASSGLKAGRARREKASTDFGSQRRRQASFCPPHWGRRLESAKRKR
jgi:hypothetical protein